VVSRARIFSTSGYTARKFLLVAFVAAYSIVAAWGGAVSRRGEFFPVFNWSLFTHLYPMQELAELHVLRAGGEPIQGSTSYYDLHYLFESARVRSSLVAKTVSQLRYALLREDHLESERLRRIIETRFLGGQGRVEYEVRVVRFMAVDRWKHNRIIDQTVLAHYTSSTTP